jgi:hypothetical protein
VTPNGSSPVYVKMVIPTTVSTSTSRVGPRAWPFGSPPPGVGLWLVGLGALGSLLLLSKRRQAMPGTLRGLSPLVARLLILSGVLLIAFSLGGCRSGTFLPAGTPPGNYPGITVDGTLNSNPAVVNTVTFALSVTPIPSS